MKSLVVDDEYAALNKLVTLLSDHGTCDAATNGRQAMDLFKKAIQEQAPYQLISIDLNLPDLDGQSLLRSFCGFEKQACIVPSKKIVVSASNDRTKVVGCAALCDAYIVKPVRRNILEEKLREFKILPVAANASAGA